MKNKMILQKCKACISDVAWKLVYSLDSQNSLSWGFFYNEK